MTAVGRRAVANPARYVAQVFAAGIAIGTVLLMLPWARAGSSAAPPLTALFTATSAVSVTGHAVVDTGTYWSAFGKVVILVLVQLGGLGFMTIASLIVMVVSRRLGLRQQIFARSERDALTLGDVRRVLRGVAVVTLTVQATAALVLTARLATTYDEPLLDAAWSGVFHAITAFNNAGFSLYPDSLVRFAADPVVLLTISAAIIIGGLGFPVLVDLQRTRGFRRLALHSKLTLTTTAVLLVLGFVVLLALEWSNPGTLGGQGWGAKVLDAGFHSVTPRTAGFNSLPTSELRLDSQLFTVLLMFIGAGSAGTSGGIKVATLAVLLLVVWAEVRGERDVSGYGRRVPEGTVRQAVVVTFLASVLVVVATAVVGLADRFDLAATLFEVVSAFGTVGLSLGITPELSAVSQLTLVVLMFVGRLGPITLGAALVLHSRGRRYRFPEEAPLIG